MSSSSSAGAMRPSDHFRLPPAVRSAGVSLRSTSSSTFASSSIASPSSSCRRRAAPTSASSSSPSAGGGATCTSSPTGTGPSDNEFQDLLQCMICFETYRHPKMLQCAHTFCMSCLNDYLCAYKQQRHAISGKLPCPTCRELTTLPKEGVTALRTDFKIHKIEEMFKTMNLIKKTALCDPCKSQNNRAKSKVYCSNCKMNFCDNCQKKHSKNSLFKKHSVVSSSRGKPTSSNLTCKVHSGEEGRYFCKTCEQLVCTLCVMNTGDHADHQVAEVEAIHLENSDAISQLQTIICTKIEHLTSKKKKLEELRQKNLNSCIQSELLIKEVTQTRIKELKALEKEKLLDLRTKRDRILESLQSETDSTDFNITKAHSLMDYGKSARDKTKVQMMAIYDELIKRMRTVVEVETSTHLNETDSVITFVKDTQPVTLGDIAGHSVHSVDRDQHRHAHNAARETTRSPSSSHLAVHRQLSHSNSMYESRAKAKLLFKVGKQGSAKGELRDPLGVACLLNGDIAVAEWGNHRIQLFDSVGKSICMIGEGKLEPQDVTVSLRGNIVASDPAHKRLEVFSPRGDVKTGESITKWGFGKFYCPCGVAMSPNGNCVVTDIDEQTINIFKGVKNCLKRIGAPSINSQPEVRFNRPLYVCIGLHNNIIISDSDNHCIKVLSSSGSFLYKFGKKGSGDGELCHPRGVCVDVQGNIYIVDRDNNRVCMFSMQGRFICHILTQTRDGIKDPMAIEITTTRNLIITETCKTRTSLKMFQL